MEQSGVLTFSQCAERMGYGPRHWHRLWRGMVRSCGFPAPLPSHYKGQRRRWSREGVDRWIASGGQPPAGGEAPPAAEDVRFARLLKDYGNA